MEHVFADTSFLVARYNRRDKHHPAAVAFLKELREPGAGPVTLVYTDYVFDETVTTLRFRSGKHQVAVSAGRALLESPALRLVPAERTVFDAAWSLFLERPDKEWSFTDCTSFTVMENLGIRKAVAFDPNFVEAGFATLP